MAAVAGGGRTHGDTGTAVTKQWIPWAERKPEHCSRILIHRSVAGQSYVDAIAYHEEPDTSMKPLADTKHITHWMPMPDAPADYAQLQASTHTA